MIKMEMNHIDNIKNLFKKVKRLKEVKQIYIKNDTYYNLEFRSESNVNDISLKSLNEQYNIIGFSNIYTGVNIITIIRVKPKNDL